MRRFLLCLTLLVIAIGVVVLHDRFLIAVHAQDQLPGLPYPLPQFPDVLPAWFPQVWSQSLLSPRPAAVAPDAATATRGIFSPGPEVVTRPVALGSPLSPPAVIPQFFQVSDPTGFISTFTPGGAVPTANNAFFSSLGSNGRRCDSCHSPQAGWAMNPALAQATFQETQGQDPLFAPVDGSNCPNLGAAAQTLAQKAVASSELLTKGNIRVFLPIPANAQFTVSILNDPYGCESSTAFGLPTGVISMYRRVMNNANLTRNAQNGLPQGTIMWDGREPTLQSQFLDATLGHAQATTPPTSAQIAQGVAFETGFFSAQEVDNQAGSLSTAPVTGGSVHLSQIGPANTPAGDIPNSFNQFPRWALSTNPAQASINRGETIFNTRTFVMTGVAGFNDVASPVVPNPPAAATITCSTCHNNRDVGSDAFVGALHLGIGDNSSTQLNGPQATATALPPTADLPLFAFFCPVNSIPFFSNPVTINGQIFDEYETTDPGKGLISGKCADLGKFKVPRLNGLAARAPYFHNGNAASLTQLVNFYNTRFNMGLSAQDQQDLINFLNAI